MKAIEIAQHGKIIPVIVIEDQKDAIPLAEALLEGGIKVLEITLRTSAALSAIEQIAKKCPEAIVGAGTVLNQEDVKLAKDAGAKFLVSPGYTKGVGAKSRELQIPLLAGVATSSEIMMALEDGYDFLKLFPAQAIGGVNLLKSWASPFKQINFCPTGGITPQNAREYLNLPNVKCVGGSWLTPQDAIKEGDFARITQLAKQACQI